MAGLDPAIHDFLLDNMWITPPPAKRWGGSANIAQQWEPGLGGEAESAPYPRPLRTTRYARGREGKRILFSRLAHNDSIACLYKLR